MSCSSQVTLFRCIILWVYHGIFYLVPFRQPSPPTRFPLITAIGMCHFLPVHHFGMASLPGSKVKMQQKDLVSSLVWWDAETNITPVFSARPSDIRAEWCFKVKDRFETEWSSASADPPAGEAMASLAAQPSIRLSGLVLAMYKAYIPDWRNISSESKSSKFIWLTFHWVSWRPA